MKFHIPFLESGSKRTVFDYTLKLKLEILKKSFQKSAKAILMMLMVLLFVSINSCNTEQEDDFSVDDQRPPIQWTKRATFDALPVLGEWLDEHNGVFLAEKQNSEKMLIITADGGQSIETIDLNINDEVFDMDFISSSTGWLTLRYSGELWKTTDGGKSFTSIYEPDTILYNVHFLDTNTGFATDFHINRRNENAIYKTTDGGNSWYKVFYKPQWKYNEFSFVDNNIGYAVGTNASSFGEDGAIIKTTNGGETWEELDIDEKKYNDFKNIVMLNENEGFLLSGGVNWTTDGFQTIESYPSELILINGETNVPKNYTYADILPLSMNEVVIYNDENNQALNWSNDGLKTIYIYPGGEKIHPEWNTSGGKQYVTTAYELYLKDINNGTILGKDLNDLNGWSGAFYAFKINN